MSTHESAIAKQPTPAQTLTQAPKALLQRTCDCGGVSKLAGGCEGCKQKRALQRKASSSRTHNSIPPIVHEVLRSSGQPLDSQTRTFMEAGFGHDFSKVRVHTDEKAGASARAVDSLAYTVGNNLVFGRGQYSPRTSQGTRLIAHELTHVVQQGEHASAMQSSLTIGQPNDRYEQEADRMASLITNRVATGERGVPAISALQGGHIQRACSSCQSPDEEKEEEKPRGMGFTFDDLEGGGEEKKEEEPAAPGKTQTDPAMLPHFVDATIVCQGGDYVVKLNDWGGKPCGISDCVNVHESSHIDDWRGRWPNGCKKADGTNQADGYLPTGGDGYAAFLKTSECTAHTKDLDCAEAKLKAATGDCKTKLEAYVKLTRDQKAGYC